MKNSAKKETGDATRASVMKEIREAADGQVRKDRGTESRYCPNSRTAKCRRGWNGR
jgi:hypothetical protein